MAMISAYNSPVFNDYWNVIKDWSKEWKDALVAKINDSERSISREESNLKSWNNIFGSLKDNMPYPSGSELNEVMKDKDKDYLQFIV